MSKFLDALEKITKDDLDEIDTEIESAEKALIGLKTARRVIAGNLGLIKKGGPKKKATASANGSAHDGKTQCEVVGEWLALHRSGATGAQIAAGTGIPVGSIYAVMSSNKGVFLKNPRGEYVLSPEGNREFAND